ncbi:MAG: TspO/MBR family protein [Bacteroidia bacterium]
MLIVSGFKKINAAAAHLQIPYLLWVTFATVLNASFYQLNR